MQGFQLSQVVKNCLLSVQDLPPLSDNVSYFCVPPSIVPLSPGGIFLGPSQLLFLHTHLIIISLTALICEGSGMPCL